VGDRPVRTSLAIHPEVEPPRPRLYPGHLALLNVILGGENGLFHHIPIEEITEDNYIIAHMWFAIANCHIRNDISSTPNHELIKLFITCGDPGATDEVDFMMDLDYTYPDFVASLITFLKGFQPWDDVFSHIHRRGYIQQHDFGIFILPERWHKDQVSLLAMLALDNQFFGYFSRCLFRLP
jgi:hypothetical protein